MQQVTKRTEITHISTVPVEKVEELITLYARERLGHPLGLIDIDFYSSQGSLIEVTVTTKITTHEDL